MNQQNEEDEIEKTEKRIKQNGKKVARETGKLIGNAAKKGIKLLIRAIGIKGFIILIVICFIFMLVPAVWYGIKDTVFNAISNITKSVTDDGSGNIKRITSIKDREFEINKDELEEKINIWLKANKVSKQQLRVI